MAALNVEETLLVDTVRAFVDREVTPSVRDVEHASTYTEAWIEQMKRIGLNRVRRRTFRDAPLMIVGEGTNEVQRNVIAAQLVARGGI